MDWGLAKLVGTPLGESENPLRSSAGHAAVVPFYNPPLTCPSEQAFGDVERVDVRADVYSLGAILYEILGGRAPYTGPTNKDILNQMLLGSPKTLRLAAKKEPEQPGRISPLWTSCLVEMPSPAPRNPTQDLFHLSTSASAPCSTSQMPDMPMPASLRH